MTNTKFSIKQFFQTNKTKKIVLIVLGALILAGIVWAIFGLHGSRDPTAKAICTSKYNKLAQEIKAANYCVQDDECASVNFPCPMLINKGKLSAITSKMDSFNKLCLSVLGWNIMKFKCDQVSDFNLTCNNGKCESARARTTEKKQKVLIRTDKTEYQRGEMVQITAKNNLGVPIWYAKNAKCGASFWFLLDHTNQEVPYYKPCDWLVPQYNFTKLNPGETLNDIWQGNLDSKGYPAPSGYYKIAFWYSLKEKQPLGGGWHEEDINRVYSNEFKIKKAG